jgi:copper chaperone NosL
MNAGPRSRILVALAAVVMLPVFFTPLWSIRLVAPQYPEGMGMHIGISEITGHDTHDIQNINILNHYIGMQAIEPEAIPELEIMPVILGALIVTGLLVALLGRRWLLAAWLVAFIGLGIAGMVDFYMWKYDYGHNLSPDAPIKVPGMTYQPPLIGSKKLLNITASSYPHVGTLLITLSVLLGALGVRDAFRKRKDAQHAETSGKRPRGKKRRGAPVPPTATVGLLVALSLVACGPGEPGDRAARDGVEAMERMVYGESEDPYCGELVETVRWGGEVRTRDGETLRFRSVECLTAHLLEQRTPADRIASVKVVDFPHGWRLIDPGDAIFLHTPNLASPTRLNLLAISTDRLAVNLQEAYSGRLMDWEEVVGLVAREWNVGPDAASAAPGRSGG